MRARDKTTKNTKFQQISPEKAGAYSVRNVNTIPNGQTQNRATYHMIKTGSNVKI